MTKASVNIFKASVVSFRMGTLKSGFYTSRTVNELLWGYEDPLLAWVASSNPEVDKVFGLMYKV